MVQIVKTMMMTRRNRLLHPPRWFHNLLSKNTALLVEDGGYKHEIYAIKERVPIVAMCPTAAPLAQTIPLVGIPKGSFPSSQATCND